MHEYRDCDECACKPICRSKYPKLGNLVGAVNCNNFVPKVKQEWISVKEELPKKQRDYLCVCQFGDDPSWRWPLVLMFYPDKNGDNGYVRGPHFADEGLNDMRVAYWMPIQKLPKE